MVVTDLYHLAEVVFGRFPPCEVTTPPIHNVPLEESHYVPPTPKQWGDMLHLLDGRVATHIFSFLQLCTGNLSLLAHVFIYSIIFISMDSWRFILHSGL